MGQQGHLIHILFICTFILNSSHSFLTFLDSLFDLFHYQNSFLACAISDIGPQICLIH